MVVGGWLADRVWTGKSLLTIAREIAGGIVLIAAMATAGALWNLHDVRTGGQIGAVAANQLNDSLNLAGGRIAGMLAPICGLAPMLKRAPAQLCSPVSYRVPRPRGEGN